MNRILDIVCAALLAAALILSALAVWQPWEADVTAAVAVHAAEPLDVNDRIIVRTETADGVALLPPREVALWEYVWLPQSQLDFRIGNFERVTGYILSDPEMQGHLERHGLTPEEQRFLRYELGVE